MSGKFLNVDLEVRSLSDLSPLLGGMGSQVIEMFCGETGPGSFHLSVELAGGFEDSAEAAANALCDVIEGLTGSAWEAWASADDRVFDFGFDAIIDSTIGQPLLSPETLQRIGGLNARVALSIYTCDLQQAGGGNNVQA